MESIPFYCNSLLSLEFKYDFETATNDVKKFLELWRGSDKSKMWTILLSETDGEISFVYHYDEYNYMIMENSIFRPLSSSEPLSIFWFQKMCRRIVVSIQNCFNAILIFTFSTFLLPSASSFFNKFKFSPFLIQNKHVGSVFCS